MKLYTHTIKKQRKWPWNPLNEKPWPPMDVGFRSTECFPDVSHDEMLRRESQLNNPEVITCFSIGRVLGLNFLAS